MLNPYKTVGKTLALFKAAGLAVPAYGENEKRRLLDAWVQRYGDVDNEVFAACSSKLASGQRFPRFYDMDEAVKIADRICILHSGDILQYDTPENILKNPADGFVSEFVGSKRIWSSPN